MHPSTSGFPPEIYFYLPEQARFDPLPESVQGYWEDYESQRGSRHYGRYSWTLKTYLYLKRYGITCNLTDALPRYGIVIAHRDFLEDLSTRALQGILLVCIKADREALETADIHIVQNAADPIVSSGKLDEGAYFIHYWPQDPLLHRDQERGATLRNVAYYGRSWHLASQLRETGWANTLEKLGLHWRIVLPDQWHDYRQVDAVVAVRSFNAVETFDVKPASKLVNAWRAGVPAILGRESAYRAERECELDYLEVNTLGETLEALNTLRSNADLYLQMAEHGERRAQAFTPECIAREWESFFREAAIPAYASKFE
jgi:hypothetical protein